MSAVPLYDGRDHQAPRDGGVRAPLFLHTGVPRSYNPPSQVPLYDGRELPEVEAFAPLCSPVHEGVECVPASLYRDTSPSRKRTLL